MKESDKFYISVTKDGKFVGFVKSVKYKNKSCVITLDLGDANGYETIDAVYTDIDFLASEKNSSEGFAFKLGEKIA